MSGFDQNVGVPGVVYILGNDGLRDNFWKIGSSRYSGQRRATDLNRDASTGTPGLFYVAHQVETLDCGSAEKEAHRRMAACRRGRHGVIEGRAWGQEFFELDLELAKRLVVDACRWADEQVQPRKREPVLGEANDRADRGQAAGPSVRTTGPAAFRWARVWPWAAGALAVLFWLHWGRQEADGAKAIAPTPKTMDGVATVAMQRPRSAETGVLLQKMGAHRSDVPAVESAHSREGPGPQSDKPAEAQGEVFPPTHALFFTRTGMPIGSAELRLEVPRGGVPHVVAVVARVPQYTPYAKVYVSAGDAVVVRVPPGRFQVLAMTGARWMGTAAMFGAEAELKPVGKPLTVDETSVGATEIVLVHR